MPIKWRSLEETLNPQPVAFDVIRKLLQYIDRCDEASKTNLPPPRFCAEDGTQQSFLVVCVVICAAYA